MSHLLFGLLVDRYALLKKVAQKRNYISLDGELNTLVVRKLCYEFPTCDRDQIDHIPYQSDAIKYIFDKHFGEFTEKWCNLGVSVFYYDNCAERFVIGHEVELPQHSVDDLWEYYRTTYPIPCLTIKENRDCNLIVTNITNGSVNRQREVSENGSKKCEEKLQRSQPIPSSSISQSLPEEKPAEPSDNPPQSTASTPTVAEPITNELPGPCILKYGKIILPKTTCKRCACEFTYKRSSARPEYAGSLQQYYVACPQKGCGFNRIPVSDPDS